MGRNYPAMAVVEVKALIEDAALIEIETTAVVRDLDAQAGRGGAEMEPHMRRPAVPRRVVQHFLAEQVKLAARLEIRFPDQWHCRRSASS